MSKEKFLLRIPEDLRAKVYKKAQEDNKSVNTTINRLINNSLMNDINYFEFQYLDTGEKFGFKEDHENPEKHNTVYRFVSINKSTGGFICRPVGQKITIEFKFSEYFYKPIFII